MVREEDSYQKVMSSNPWAGYWIDIYNIIL